MLLILAYLFTLLCSTGAFEIKQVDSNGAHLIETSPTNYALSSPDIIQNGWKTVSTNGDQVSIFSADCQVTLKSIESLSDSELDLMNKVESQLSNVVNIQGSQVSYKISRFSTDGSVLQQKSRGINIDRPEFNTNVGPSISKSDEDDYSISRAGLPMNLARVFVKSDVITFVYLDSQVEMKPIGCLEPSEQSLIEQLQVEVKQAEEHYKLIRDDSPHDKMFGDAKDNIHLNDNPLNRLNDWDNIFVHPPLSNPMLIPPIEHVHPPYHPPYLSFPGQRPGLNQMNIFHPQHQPVDSLASIPSPSAPFHGGPFNDLARNSPNVYKPMYNNLRMGDVNRGFIKQLIQK